MKTASVGEIKQELTNASSKELLEVCLRLIKFKKENKELVNYLLFEAGDLRSYIENIKMEIDEQYAAINKTNLYFARKSVRKILRTTNKFIKYTASKETEIELLIYYCVKLKSSGIAIHKSASFTNLLEGQIKKINKTIGLLHEDLQYEYRKNLDRLQ